MERLAAFIVDGQEKLEAKNRELRSLVRLTMSNAKAEREHKEELEDSLTRRRKNQYEANLERTWEGASSHSLEAALQSEARDNL